MLIAITGTPGTGKTQVAKELGRLLDYEVVSITNLVKSGKIKAGYDRERKTYVVDEKRLDKNIRKLVEKKKNYIIESHLAHFVRADVCVVLRTNPKELERRMERKKWKRKKIRENIEAEILDLITAEAMADSKNIIEIDTSRKTARQTARLIKKVLNNHALQKNYRAGRIDWSERYRKYLVK